MIQVFDPHRTMYRNAKLRAFSDEGKTTRIKFFDMTNVEDETQYDDIGLEVSTDQNGYIMRSGGQQKVNCLAVDEDAIIEVSLDGGTSWPIQWILHAGDTGTNTKVKKLYFFNGQGSEQSGNLSDTEIHLPDYLLRSEANLNNVWAESEVVVSGGAIDSWESVGTNEWTHIITFTNLAFDESKFVVGGPLRDGQTILIYNKDAAKSVKMAIDDLSNPIIIAPGRFGIMFKSDDTIVFKMFNVTSAGNNDGYTIVAAELLHAGNIDVVGSIVYIAGTFLSSAPHIATLNADNFNKLVVINDTAETITVRWLTSVTSLATKKTLTIYRPQPGTFFTVIA